MGTTTAVTVIIPVWNGDTIARANLIEIADHFAIYRAYDFHLLLLDFSAGGKAAETIDEFARHRRNVSIFARSRTTRLASALIAALRGARGRFAVVLDGALRYHPSAGVELLELLERETADIAIRAGPTTQTHRTAGASHDPAANTPIQTVWSTLRWALCRTPALCFACRLS